MLVLPNRTAILAGLAALIFMAMPLEASLAQHDGHGGGGGGDDEGPIISEIFVDIPQIITNVHTGSGSHYLLLNLSVELEFAADAPMVNEAMPLIQDMLQAYLRSISFEDLSGSAALYQLRRDLHHRIQLAVLPIPVSNVLFTEILTQ